LAAASLVEAAVSLVEADWEHQLQVVEKQDHHFLLGREDLEKEHY
jgi:hypothetical protein